MKKTFLKSYFQRIHLAFSEECSLENLQAIQTHHAQHIPFEGLHPYLVIPVLLDIPSIAKKMLTEQRGGYCFEQNILLREVLSNLGYTVRGVLGRVIPVSGPLPGRTHMILIVEINEGKYIMDVGFGSLVPIVPIKLAPDEIQETVLNTYRILEKTPQQYTLQILLKKKWITLYTFDLNEYIEKDFEVANWYTSTHSNSGFKKNLMASRIENGKRYALLNTNFTIHDLQKSEKIKITSVEAFKEILTNDFKINLSTLKNIDSKLQEIITKNS